MRITFGELKQVIKEEMERLAESKKLTPLKEFFLQEWQDDMSEEDMEDKESCECEDEKEESSDY